MEQTINEAWLQFGYLNAKGNVVKTALKIPFHTQLKIDQEIPITILGKVYNFSCVREETVSNNSDTVDKIYVIATNHQ